MSGRLLKLGGVVAAGGAGYYLYKAGGDPKAAEKHFEGKREGKRKECIRAIQLTVSTADATKLSNDVQNKLPGRADEAKKDAQVAQADISAKANELYKDAKGQLKNAEGNFEKYKADAEKRLEKSGKEAADQANKAIDKFDKNVTEGADKAKSGISSWFGGSK